MKNKTEILRVRCPVSMKTRIERLAARRGESASIVIREALIALCDQDDAKRGKLKETTA